MTMHYAIEDGIPIPPSHMTQNAIYPFREMQVGQSFSVPADKARTIRSMAHNRGKQLGRKFVVRKFGEGLRVWRVG